MSFSSRRCDVWLVVAAKSASWFGDELAAVTLLLRLQSHGHDASAVAALLIANALPIVLLSGVVGRLVDRVNNRILLVTSSLAQAAVCAVLASAGGTGPVLALVAMLGAGQAANGATWQALLPAIVTAGELPRAIGRTRAGATLAGILAPPLAGLLTGRYGAPLPLLLDAATYLAVTVAALLISTRRVVTAPEDGQRRHGGLAIVRRDPLLRSLFGLLSLFVLLGSMVNVVEVFLVRETLHASTTWYGLCGATFSAGALAGALRSGRLRGVMPLARAFIGSCVVLALGLAGIGTVPSVGWLLPVGFVAGAANGVLNVTLATLVMGRAVPEERGRVGALLTGLASGTQLVAFAVAGAASGALTPREIFVAAGALGLLAPGLLGRPLLRAVRQSEDNAVAAAPA